MSGIFRDRIEFNVLDLKYYVQSDDDVHFRVWNNIMGDDDLSLVYDSFMLSNSYDHKYDEVLASYIKTKLKKQDTEALLVIANKLDTIDANTLGRFNGTRDFALKLDFRLHSVMKGLPIPMVRFINLAVLEKLERDNLI